MSACERAVIYVDPSKKLHDANVSMARRGERAGGTGAGGGSNYVIKIQIGDDANEFYDQPVRIDVTRKIGSGASRGKFACQYKRGVGHNGQESPLNSSGQSSPRSDMTPPPAQNNHGRRYGSETSESDTESDLSTTEYRLCSATQYVIRDMYGAPIRSQMSDQSSIVSISDMNELEATVPSQHTQPLCSTIEVSEPEAKTRVPNDNEAKSVARNVSGSENAKSRNEPTQFVVVEGQSCRSATSTEFIEFPRQGSQTKCEGDKCASESESRCIQPSQGINGIVKGNIQPNDASGFHINEVDECNRENGEGSSSSTAKQITKNFAGYKNIFTRNGDESHTQIMSDRGTIRGVKNRVRDGIATFLQTNDSKSYTEKEQGRVVIYVTSMGVVRDTFQRCQKVKQILRNLLVKFDERDCYMNRAIQNELKQRLETTGSPTSQENSKILVNCNNNEGGPKSILNDLKKKLSCSSFIPLPQVFLEGQYLGDAEMIEKLNETGELRDLLKPYKCLSVLSTCGKCGGFRMLPCPVCNGSKKSVHRNHFTSEFVALKCMHCDLAGLIRCDLCDDKK